MKRAYLSVFTFIILFIGGCGLMGDKDISKMDPKDLPEVTAFQDEFTREFMTSTEEVEEGYYLFESKTGGYTMWYPEEATMDKHFYERKKKHFERLQFAEDNDTNSTPYYVVATYDHSQSTQDVDILLHLLSSSINYEGDYEKLEHQGYTIYFATSEYTTKDKRTTWYRFFGLIKDKNQSLEYTYNVQCKDQPENCSYDLEAIEQRVKDIMKSVEFKDVELEEGQN